MSVITITRGLSTCGSTRAAIAAHRSRGLGGVLGGGRRLLLRVGGFGSGGSAGPHAISPAANATAVGARDRRAARDHFAAGGSV